MQHMSIYKINGLNPSPQVEMKLKTQAEDPIQGCVTITNCLGANNAQRYHKFKSFFAVAVSKIITLPRSTHPNWKVELFMKHVNCVNREAVGENWVINEQTMGSKGNMPTHVGMMKRMKGADFKLTPWIPQVDTHMLFTSETRHLPKYILIRGFSIINKDYGSPSLPIFAVAYYLHG